MISVIIPVLNESPSVYWVTKFARSCQFVNEVIVVDDGSIDGSPEIAAEAGARVIHSTLLGKGASMEDGVWEARNEVVAFLDGDLKGLDRDLLEKLVAPILNDQAELVKARFTRASGRVTLLTAKPLLQTFFPELNEIDQPLGGIIAGTRSLFRRMRFETDYGVDVGLLLDASAMGSRIAQVDIGHVEHDSQSLEVLGDMAKQVTRVILSRAAKYGRLDLGQLREVEEVERRAQGELTNILSRVGKPERLALFDMDGTLVQGRFAEALARRTNRIARLEELLDHEDLEASERTKRIAAIFSGIPKSDFEQTALELPLMKGAMPLVVALKKAGYRVGIVSDSYFVATEIVRRRVFGDFSVAHLMRFRDGVSTGRVLLSNAMQHDSGCPSHSVCKLNTLLHLSEQLQIDPANVISIGDGEPDICMLEGSGSSFAYCPKTEQVRLAAKHIVEDHFQIASWLGLNLKVDLTSNSAWTSGQSSMADGL